MNNKAGNWLATTLLILCLLPALALAHKPYDRLFIFGDSLSDPGNAYYLLGTALTPPYETLDALLIPDAPYAIGGHHFSNGSTWIEQLARQIDLNASAEPAFRNSLRRRNKAGNYAVGGARARDSGSGVDLPLQVGAYLASGATASDRSLYVIVFGGNDVRDAIAALALDPGGATSATILGEAITSISDNILTLYSQGAREFFIGNSPDLSLTPAIRTLDLFSPGTQMAAAIITAQFNAGIDSLIDNLQSALPDLTLHTLDLSGMLHELVANPEQYRLTNVTDGCVMPGIPPFACSQPKRYLYWDGIHPTTRTHSILAGFAKDVLFPDESPHKAGHHDRPCREPVRNMRDSCLKTRHQ